MRSRRACRRIPLANVRQQAFNFRLRSQRSRQLNFDVLKRNTLAEIYDPQVQPRTTPIVQSHTILREPRRYHLTSAPRTKQYRLVYTKRLLDPDTCLTYPFGYDFAPPDPWDTLFAPTITAPGLVLPSSATC